MKSEDFFANISRSLGREASPPLIPDVATHLSSGEERVRERTQQITGDIEARAGELLDQMRADCR